ncbi:cytochrome c biogenesis protein CcdA [Candidatus Woesearchaeota archaeon]|nr:cytochrome c biogenesis protein CcdA [Candidatus Woesearchaeota archaeon]
MNVLKLAPLAALTFVLLSTAVLAHGGFDDGHPDGPLDLPEGVLKIIEYRNELAAGITFLAAFLAGIVAFTSPCGFVLLPTFFAFLFKERKRALLMTSLFAVGLTLGFTLLGVLAALAGVVIGQFRAPFAVFSGVVFVVFGIMMFLNKGFSWFQFKLDHHKTKSAVTMTSMGFFFALGWSPCIGPVLGGILLLAANAGTVLSGASYLFLFALGVSVPLLLVAAFADRLDLASKSWIKGRLFTFRLFGTEITTHTYNIVSAIILVALGVIMIFSRGTSWVEYAVTRVVPWSMTLFYAAHDMLTQTPFFTSTTAQVLGIIAGLLVLGSIAHIIYRQWTTKHEL